MDVLEQLNSECFIYNNDESNWWSSFDIDFIDSLCIETIKQIISKYAVGYCDGSRISVKPRTNSFAVMFEKDESRFWFHVEDWMFVDQNETANK